MIEAAIQDGAVDLGLDPPNAHSDRPRERLEEDLPTRRFSAESLEDPSGLPEPVGIIGRNARDEFARDRHDVHRPLVLDRHLRQTQLRRDAPDEVRHTVLELRTVRLEQLACERVRRLSPHRFPHHVLRRQRLQWTWRIIELTPQLGADSITKCDRLLEN
ncbi:hypothetical protein DUHN55_21810 [Helicobacter pylori]